MAKKITDFKNPLTATSGSIFDVSMWTGGILWVMMFGLITAVGVKALNIVDSKVPGNQTPRMKPFEAPVVTGSGYNVL